MLFRIIILLVFLTFFSCAEKKEPTDISKNVKNQTKKSNINQDSIERIKLEKEHDIFPLINYEQIVIRDNKHRSDILKEFEDTKANFAKNKTIITMNRKARHYMRVGDTIVLPDSIYDDMRAYSVFPMYYHGAKDLEKLVVVSNKYQAYACYENGVQVRFAPCNTGKEKTQTYPGRYSMVWKQLIRRSSIDSNWVLPFTVNFHRYAGSAFHQFTMPGYAASHSCVRQFEDDAEWLYNWGKTAKYDSNSSPIPFTGTPVIIIDVFDYTRPKTGPWLSIKHNKDVILQLPEDPMAVEEAYIPISQIPEIVRGGLPNKDRYKYAEDTLRARGIIREGVRITESVDFNKKRREKKRREALAKKKAEEEAARKAKEIVPIELSNTEPPQILIKKEQNNILQKKPPQ